MTWNVFRYLGDFSHLLSFVFLIHRLYTSKTSMGISLKTQELYLLVFITRYLDLFKVWHSLYNTAMKILYIALSALVVYALRFRKPWSSSYESETKKDDTYPHIKFAVLPALAVALVFNESPGILSLFSRPFSWAFEVAWAFSIFLEAIAFFPQLTLMYTQEKVEGITSHYLASLGAYRGLYLANWVWRYATESNYWAPIPWVAGIIQTGFYIDFLRVYFKHFRLEDLSLNKMNTYLPLSK